MLVADKSSVAVLQSEVSVPAFEVVHWIEELSASVQLAGGCKEDARSACGGPLQIHRSMILVQQGFLLALATFD